jgi:hypothetical protein
MKCSAQYLIWAEKGRIDPYGDIKQQAKCWTANNSPFLSERFFT